MSAFCQLTICFKVFEGQKFVLSTGWLLPYVNVQSIVPCSCSLMAMADCVCDNQSLRLSLVSVSSK